VRIDSIDQQQDRVSSDDGNDESEDGEEDDVNMDTATRPLTDSEPLLVVFSNNRHHRRFDSLELHEIIEREMELYETGDLPAAAVSAAGLSDYDDDDEYDDGDYDADYDDNRLDADGDRIISRVERDTDSVFDARFSSPSDRGTATRRDLAATDETSAATRVRVRRAKFRRRLRRNICRRRPMYVNFEDIHWNGWIIEPKGYQV